MAKMSRKTISAWLKRIAFTAVVMRNPKKRMAGASTLLRSPIERRVRTLRRDKCRISFVVGMKPKDSSAKSNVRSSLKNTNENGESASAISFAKGLYVALVKTSAMSAIQPTARPESARLGAKNTGRWRILM